MFFCLPDDVDLPRDAGERIFRRLVTVTGRIGRRTLDVRIVVRAAGCDAHKTNVEFLEQMQECNRFAKVE